MTQSVPPLDPGFDLNGPLESASFPETLTARVVTPGTRASLHGFDVETDLARHYDPTEISFLALTGELPESDSARALRVACAFLAPVSVAHASVHAATLARLCGTTISSTIGVAAIGLAEQTRVLVDEHTELLDWLRSRSDPFPARFQSNDPADTASVERLRAALGPTGLLVPELEARPSRNAALLVVLFTCGLRRREQLEAAIVTARLPIAIAEALAEKVVDFAHYPINLPHYRYEELP